MYSLKIKISNITNLSDARYAAAMGIDYMGFCFDKTDANYIALSKAKEIIEWTSGNLIVAEFGLQSTIEIESICKHISADVVEVNNKLLPYELATLNLPVIKKIDVNMFDNTALQKELDAYKNVCYAFHLYASSLPQKYDCNSLLETCKTVKIIWGLGYTISNTKNIINSFNPYAINTYGGHEEKTGLKDFDDINDWLDSIRLEET